jgi:hypothetical protein
LLPGQAEEIARSVQSRPTIRRSLPVTALVILAHKKYQEVILPIERTYAAGQTDETPRGQQMKQTQEPDFRAHPASSSASSSIAFSLPASMARGFACGASLVYRVAKEIDAEVGRNLKARNLRTEGRSQGLSLIGIRRNHRLLLRSSRERSLGRRGDLFQCRQRIRASDRCAPSGSNIEIGSISMIHERDTNVTVTDH